ncbi:hypothetical protein ACFWA9_04725 [Kitasatospora sp. NPDC059973]|uniref:hypothetical protein n=1 Tax=Kitasatospora sp. NPDC059973 TaxID=3347020 RepID=UPI0036CCFED6
MTLFDPSAQNPAPEPRPFLPARTLLILLAAAVIGLVVAGLIFLDAGHGAAAAAAGLAAFGASVMGLHKLIS